MTLGNFKIFAEKNNLVYLNKKLKLIVCFQYFYISLIKKANAFYFSESPLISATPRNKVRVVGETAKLCCGTDTNDAQYEWLVF